MAGCLSPIFHSFIETLDTLIEERPREGKNEAKFSH